MHLRTNVQEREMKRDYGTNGTNGKIFENFRLFRFFRLFRNLSSSLLSKSSLQFFDRKISCMRKFFDQVVVLEIRFFQSLHVLARDPEIFT
jgi:hypothetical protein